MAQMPRREIRIPVEGNIVYSVGFATQGGAVKDISMHGCLVESDRPPHPASMLSCRIDLPEMDEPVEVQLALVQWVQGSHFGLKIVEMSVDTQKRLRRFLDDNYVQLARARRGRHRLEPASPEPSPSVMVSPLWAASAFAGDFVPPNQDPSARDNCLGNPVAIPPQDLSAFVGWILDAWQAFEQKEPLPAPPMLEFTEFKACTQFIQTLLHESRSARSRSTESSSRHRSQHEMVAHPLTQLKTDDSALQDAPTREAGVPQDDGYDSESTEPLTSVEERAERRVQERRSVPRTNKPRRLPLSVRLARLTAKLKLPFWFARV